MNRLKLAESVEVFKQTYLLNRPFYDEDERNWKVRLSRQFQVVFTSEVLASGSFLDSLTSLFKDRDARSGIVLLCGGAYYQHQRFVDLLETVPDQSLLAECFTDLLFSQDPIGDRVNRFKRQVDRLYERLARKGKIQLSLISQFLGLTLPAQYYIYKYSEFAQAAKYFEYEAQRTSNSTGAWYEYYFGLCDEIKAAMSDAGLDSVDYIDVQTFVFRSDWYTPADAEREKDALTAKIDELESLSLRELVGRLKKNRSGKVRIASQVYYYRDPNVAALVKKDAQGLCDLCRKPAPFANSKGIPYLENHHIQYLADGGEDTVMNCVALCPNCHAKMHVLNLESDRRALQAVATKRHERLMS